MKKIVSAFISFLAVLLLVCIVNAELIDNMDGTITDTDTGLMWLKDANLAGTIMTYDPAKAWANSLVYAGYDDWRLPSALNSDGSGPCEGHNCIDSEMGHIYYTELGNIGSYDGCTLGVNCGLVNSGPFINLLVGNHYWSNTPHAFEPTFQWDFNFNEGIQNGNPKAYESIAWAVRVVPEPISSILFITGGATLGLRRYLKFKGAK